MPRSLVTGATGFVGSNLVAELRQRGWDVDCLVRDARRAAGLQALGAKLRLGSLSDAENIERGVAEVDVVYHVAGRVRALNNRQFDEDNVVGTLNVVEACAARPNPPVVVLVSSLAAGGPSKPGAPRGEADPDQPISDYGRSKLAAEHGARRLASRVNISVLRPPIIFGPADRASLAIFRGVQRMRLHAVPGFRRFPVSLVHVADLCDALVRIAEGGARLLSDEMAADKNDSTGIYHVAAERTIGYGELGKLAARAIGCRAVTLPIPRPLFWLAGGVAELIGQIRRRPGVLNLDKVREAVASGWECCDKKIRDELGYQPEAPLEQRFAETTAWYREQGWL